MSDECAHSRAAGYLCSLGLFIAGYVFYSSSLIQAFYTDEFSLSGWQTGLAQSAVPFGAIIGAVMAGRLSDLLGRHRLLVLNFLALVVANLSAAAIFNFESLLFVRFLDGCLAGTLYPLCAAYLTEVTHPAALARRTAQLMFINCLAAPVACMITIILSMFCQAPIFWRMILVSLAVPAMAAYLWSTMLPESQQWLRMRTSLLSTASTNDNQWKSIFSGVRVLFSPRYLGITCCLMGAWFLMDVAYYGINFFVPYLLRAMQFQSLENQLMSGSQALLEGGAIWGTMIINLFFALGAMAALFAVDRIELIRLQKNGFLWAGLSMCLLAGCFYTDLQHDYLIIILFIIFNAAINMGPDVTTYLFSATSYPVEIRGSGHGLIAGFAKFGSFLGVLLLPWLQDMWGYRTIIMLLSFCLFTAYVLTVYFARIVSAENYQTEVEVQYEAS